jgi:hypothetical protein
MSGSGVRGLIVQTPLTGLQPASAAATIWKLMVSAPAEALACSMAARSVQTPPAVRHRPSEAVRSGSSAVELTTKVEPACARGRSPAARDARARGAGAKWPNSPAAARRAAAANARLT